MIETKTIEFWVAGIPATAGSKTPFIYRSKSDGKQRVAMVPANKRQKSWMESVRSEAAKAYSGPVISSAIMLNIDFHFIRPKSHFGTGGNTEKVKKSAPLYHIQKPDRGKLDRCIEDSMTGVIFRDDCQVVYCESRKCWSTISGANIRINYEKEVSP